MVTVRGNRKIHWMQTADIEHFEDAEVSSPAVDAADAADLQLEQELTTMQAGTTLSPRSEEATRERAFWAETH